MKLLLDFLPIVLFFITYKWGHAQPEAAQAWVEALLLPFSQQANSTLATLSTQAPILLATVAAIAATALQIAIQKVLKRRIEATQWLGFGLIVVFGGATLILQNEAFIKWKPTLLYAIMAAALALTWLGFGINLVQRMMQEHIQLPQRIWTHLLGLWCVFFVSMALLNAWVVHYFSTDTWVNFKLYGTLGATLVFVIGQGIYIARHAQNQDPIQPTNHSP